jgi:Ca2+-binding RTX toxin-like protein
VKLEAAAAGSAPRIRWRRHDPCRQRSKGERIATIGISINYVQTAREGDDTVIGNGGVDALFGGDDDDQIAGGPDADSMGGGPGLDRADYSASGTGIDVTIDDVANDGIPAEGDNVTSTIENVLGGRFDDKIDGNSDPNGLSGGLGADLLRGFGGADLIAGGGGVDDLRGAGGADELHAVDAIQDSLLCGTEIDSYAADGIDTVSPDCENALP